MYLPLDLVHDFLEMLRARIQSLIVAFDYFSEHVINRTSGNETMTAASDYFENHFGAKWVTGFDDLSVFERRNQLRIIRSGAMLDVCRRYAPESAPRPLQNGRGCTPIACSKPPEFQAKGGYPPSSSISQMIRRGRIRGC